MYEREANKKVDAAEKRSVDLSDKVKELEDKIELSAKKAVHEKLFTENKINAAQLEALNAGKGQLEVLALSEKMNTKASGTEEVNEGEEIKLNAAEQSVCEQLGLSAEEFNVAN